MNNTFDYYTLFVLFTLMANSDIGLVLAYCILSAKSLMAPVFVYLLMKSLCRWLFSGVTTRQWRTPSRIASMLRNSVDFNWNKCC